MYESWEDCAVREVKEETDLDIAKPTFAHVTNDRMEDEGACVSAALGWTDCAVRCTRVMMV
jgi:ADP-ribose pyrophosphatase YjhB (NUDIX family)